MQGQVESYKDQFLQTVSDFRRTRDQDLLRAQELAKSNQFQATQQRSHIGSLTKITNTNDIWASNQYSTVITYIDINPQLKYLYQNIRIFGERKCKHPSTIQNIMNRINIKVKRINKQIILLFIRQFGLINTLNPEVARSENNMRVTRISEYSNALHNNRIFLNPKFTSC